MLEYVLVHKFAAFVASFLLPAEGARQGIGIESREAALLAH